MSILYIKIFEYNKWILLKLFFYTMRVTEKFLNIKISLLGILIYVYVYM